MKKIKLHPNQYDGKLIAIDGRDGSGKTTIVDALCEYYKKKFCFKKVKLPSPLVKDSKLFYDFAYNKIWDDPIKGDALQLLHMADRLQILSNEIIPALAIGQNVIIDRYLISSMLTIDHFNLSKEWFESVCTERIIQPNIWIYMYVTPENALDRLNKRIKTEKYSPNIQFDAIAESYNLELEYAQINELLILNTNKSNSEECLDIIINETMRQGIL